ncbi:MAG TPA: DUF6580 family putative transport protein [Bryobacteraceae bacterium]
MDQKKSSFQPLALSLTVGAALLRLAPHPPNFAPVGGLALFGGARFRGWQAYAIPLLAMVVTDPILSHMMGFSAYSWGTLVIYGCFLINVLLGRAFLRDTNSPGRIAAVTLAGSTQFFLITNFFSWSMYPHTAAGLAECYIAALPFFGRTILGDLFYVGVLFGAYELLRRGARRHVEANAQA